MFDKKTIVLLRAFYKADRLTNEEVQKISGDTSRNGHDQHIQALFVAKAIDYWSEQIEVDGLKDFKNVGYKITLEGRAYIENQKRNTLNFWVPYTLTTLLAVASLICSILSIIVAARAG